MTLHFFICNLQRRALHPDATQLVLLREGSPHLRRWAALGSWIGLLISAVSEYGFDVDFPLTPPVWLMIAVCAAAILTVHTVIGNRPQAKGRRGAAACWSSDTQLLSRLASFITNGIKSPRASDRSQSIDQCDFNNQGDHRAPMSSYGATVAASDAMPAFIFLGSATSRGPPWAGNQIDPARQFCSLPLPSKIHVHNSLAARNAFLSGTDPTPIRSAIEGDHT